MKRAIYDRPPHCAIGQTNCERASGIAKRGDRAAVVCAEHGANAAATGALYMQSIAWTEYHRSR